MNPAIAPKKIRYRTAISGPAQTQKSWIRVPTTSDSAVIKASLPVETLVHR
jgi:hypothetical protein